MLAILALTASQDDTRVQLYFPGGLAPALSPVDHLRQKTLSTRN
ncbi:hypothetical protein ACWEQ8_14615 [Streptomyces noursei]